MTMPESTTAAPATELRAGDLRLLLRPEIGGAIAGLWHGDTMVLRSNADGDADSARELGCFPLVPYSNRLGYCRFHWRGHGYTTAPNFDVGPHSLHGIGWRRPWNVLAADTEHVLLRLHHAGDADWPFAFDATQRIDLSPDRLRIEMTATNRHAEPAPMGLGWHPYFPKRARSRMHLELAARWEPDAAGLPTRAVAQPGIDADVATLAFDHCFDRWQGAARLRDERLQLRLTSSLDRVVVFTPQDKPFYCVEPVSHVTNAIHMADPEAHGLRTLAPGETMTAWMALDIART